MNTRILFVGLEVDDNAFHACLMAKVGEESFEIKCKPTVSALASKLQKYLELGWELRICYEATYLGFSVCRGLRKLGFDCEVVAPALIPQTQGPRVKTDKIDCRKLARYYKMGLLTLIHIPEMEDEVVRDLMRSRIFLVQKLRSTRCHILSLCRRMGLNYREEVGQNNHWTDSHIRWLKGKVETVNNRALRFNLTALLTHMDQMMSQISSFDQEIGTFSQIPRYEKKVKALTCFRGIDRTTAMVLATELGDVNRFGHPKRMVSYLGMDIAEYSSGGHEKKFRITKMGNLFARTAVIEACQTAWTRPVVSSLVFLHCNDEMSLYR